jgi:hypothetical protein
MANDNVEKFVWSDFFVKNSKRIFIGISVLSVIAVMAGGGLWYYYNVLNKDVVARVGSKMVSRQTYEADKERCIAAADFSKDKVAKEQCSKEALDSKILLLSLEQEAIDRKLVLDEESLEKSYSDFVSEYGSEQNMLSAMSQIKSDAVSVKESFRLKALKELVGPYLIAEKDVQAVFARWDWYKDTLGVVDTEGAARALTLQKVKESYVPLFAKVPFPKTEEIDATVLKFQKDNPIWEREWRSRTFEMVGLNPVTSKETFTGDTEWAAISSLQEGEVSEPVVSDGGYVAIYRVTKSNNGAFTSWDDYLASVKKKTNIQDIGYNINNFKSQISHSVSHNLALFVRNFPIVGTALAADLDCSSNHFSSLKVVDTEIYGTSTTLTGIRVDWDSSAPTYYKSPDGECPACKNPVESCSGNFTTGTNGWSIGDKKDAQQKWLSCWSRYNITLSKSGYYSMRYLRRSTDVNGSTTYLDKKNDSYSSLQEYDGDNWVNGSADFRNGNLNNNGYISLRLRPNYTATLTLAGNGTGSVSASPANELGCTKANAAANATCSNSFQEKATPYERTLTATPGTGSVLTGWTGCTSLSGSLPNQTCTIKMNADRSVTATFTIGSYLVRPSADTGCAISPAVDQTVSYDGTIAFEGAIGSAGYTFDGFSVDGAATVAPTSIVSERNYYTFTGVRAGHTIRAKCTPPPAACNISSFTAQHSPDAVVSSGGTMNFVNTTDTIVKFNVASDGDTFKIVYGDGTFSNNTAPGTQLVHSYPSTSPNSGDDPFDATVTCSPGGAPKVIHIYITGPSFTVNITDPTPPGTVLPAGTNTKIISADVKSNVTGAFTYSCSWTRSNGNDYPLSGENEFAWSPEAMVNFYTTGTGTISSTVTPTSVSCETPTLAPGGFYQVGIKAIKTLGSQVASDFTTFSVAVPNTLSCSATPTSGDSPLPVKVELTPTGILPGNPSPTNQFTIKSRDINTGVVTETPRVTTITKYLSLAKGIYDITVESATWPSTTCGRVTVNDSGSSGGGEVTP